MDGGRILVDGNGVVIDDPASARDVGISVIHQEFHLTPDLTVAQNIFLGREPRRGGMFIMQAHPDLAGVFGANEGSAIGVVNAVKETGKAGELSVIGFDSGKAQADAIRGDVMSGAITQNPISIGYETVKAAVAAINDEEVDEEIDTGYFWYDQNNIDDPEIQEVIYEERPGARSRPVTRV